MHASQEVDVDAVIPLPSLTIHPGQLLTLQLFCLFLLGRLHRFQIRTEGFQIFAIAIQAIHLTQDRQTVPAINTGL